MSTLVPPASPPGASAADTPPELHYLMEHQVWARLEEGGATALVGITALGIRLSGEVYMCRAKRPGTEVAQGGTIAVVELAKSVVAVKSPVSGTVIAINEDLQDRPELVHQQPYGQGWIARLRLTHWPQDQAALLHGQAAAAAMAHHAWLHRQELLPATAGPAQP